MNAKNFFMAATIAAWGLTACTNDDEGTIPAREEVKISTSVNGNGRTTRASIDPATGEGNLDDGDKILLVAQKAGDAIRFEEYTIGASTLYWENLISGNYSGTEWSGDNSLFPLGEPPYDFIAYYPNVPFGEISASGFNAATAANPDLLGAKAEAVAKGGTVDLTFGHLMHKLTVNLSSTFYTNDDLVDAVVSVKNLYSTAAVELIDATVDNGGASGTDPYPAETGVSTCFIVAPQDLPAAGTELLEIVVGGKTYTYKIPATGLTALESGMALTLSFSLSRNAVALQSNTVQPWGNLAEIQVEIAAGTETKFQYRKFTNGSVSIDAAFIPAGTFRMGSPLDEPGHETDEMQHTVTLTQDFYMGKYEVTNAQYAAFLNDAGVGSTGDKADIEGGQRLISASSRSYDWGLHWNAGTSEWEPAPGCANRPVIHITWYGAKAFAEWAGGSLPTEAQREYACRGGQAESLPFGIGDGKVLDGYMANINGNYVYDYDRGGNQTGGDTPFLSTTVAVGSYSPNDYGLYDMHGNVTEWCLDWYAADYGRVAVTDPTGAASGSDRVVRGGGWSYYAGVCRSARRVHYSPAYDDYGIGFRVVFFP